MSDEKLTPHPKAEILRAIADGKIVQRRNALYIKDDWFDDDNPLVYLTDDTFEWRVKPETITINGHEVPAPVREPLKEDQEFFMADGTQVTNPVRFYWSSKSRSMLVWLERGLIHLTEEAAIAHAEALLSFTRSDK